jgi:hypothetical protein
MGCVTPPFQLEVMTMTIKIEIQTDNAAFDDPYEVGRILRQIASEIDNGNLSDIDVRDVNGNDAGFCRVD